MASRWQRPTTTTTTIAGGYLLVRSHALLALWQAYSDGHLTLLDVRTALAAAEQRHRIKTARSLASRVQAKSLAVPTARARQEHTGRAGQHSRGLACRPSTRRADRPDPVDSSEEPEALRSLTRCSDVRKVRAALHRLADAAVPPEQLSSRAGSCLHLAIRCADGVADRPVPVPRRWLRAMVADGTASTIAICLAHLLRGAFLCRGELRFGGTCSAAWVAQIFSIDERTAKAGRSELVRIGWLIPIASPVGHRQRYGASFTLSTDWSASKADWSGPAGRVGRSTQSAGTTVAAASIPDRSHVPGSPPHQQPAAPGLPPPWENKNLPLRGANNQNRPAGSCVPGTISGQRPADSTVESVGQAGAQPGAQLAVGTLATHGPSQRSEGRLAHYRRPRNTSQSAPGAQPPNRSTMLNIQPADLDDPLRTEALFADAQRCGIIGEAPSDRLRFFTTVQHARTVGKRPCALLSALARSGRWHFGTLADEDVARGILRRLDGRAGSVGELAMFGQRPVGVVSPVAFPEVVLLTACPTTTRSEPLQSAGKVLGSLGLRFAAA